MVSFESYTFGKAITFSLMDHDFIVIAPGMVWFWNLKTYTIIKINYDIIYNLLNIFSKNYD